MFSPVVIMYHSINDSRTEYSLGYDSFLRHLEKMHRLRWYVLSLNEYMDAVRQRARFNRPAVLLTFDDGYEDVYTKVYPACRKYGYPFTVFISAAHIGKNNDWNPRASCSLRHLSVAQVSELAKEGVDFGCHGMAHHNFLKMRESELKEDLQESSQIITNIIGKDLVVCAYPYGAYSETVLNVVSSMFELGFTSSPCLQREKSSLYSKYENLMISRVDGATAIGCDRFISAIKWMSMLPKRLHFIAMR